MRAKHADLTSLTWLVMDVRKMTFKTGSLFNVAIDKVGLQQLFEFSGVCHRELELIMGSQGTLDAMLYGSLWDPEDEVKSNVRAYVDEVCTISTLTAKAASLAA